MDSLPALWRGWLATDPARPAVTFYDDATGDRTELSGATLANWVAKTANLLVDGCGAAPGDRVAVALPAHWQSAAVLLGCWSAGLVTGADDDPAAVVAFAAADRLAAAGPGTGGGAGAQGDFGAGAADRFVLGLAPMAQPLRTPPPGWVDYVTEVRQYGDHFTPAGSVRPQHPADAKHSHADLVAAARSRNLPPGARLLIDGDAYPDPVDWLLAPIAAGGSVVLCRNLDPAKVAGRIAAERVTATIT